MKSPIALGQLQIVTSHDLAEDALLILEWSIAGTG